MCPGVAILSRRESWCLTALPNCPSICPGVSAYFSQPVGYTCFVDLPAGFHSDDEYVSEEEDEKDNNTLIPARKFQGVHPPPGSQDISSQSFKKDLSKSSLPTTFTWTRNTCAVRAPGTDPMKLRNVVGLNTGKESGMKNDAALASRDHCADRNNLDNSAPFGVPRKLRAKAETDTANWAWVEQVLKIKSEESTALRGSLEVRMQPDCSKFY